MLELRPEIAGLYQVPSIVFYRTAAPDQTQNAKQDKSQRYDVQMRVFWQRAIALHFVLGIPLAVNAASRPGCAVGIDHMPVAVSDLDRAAETYRRLGFAIKPGRFHADGIQNRHVKFEDGGGIELITAQRAVDAQSENYLKLLSQGEGPAFLSFHTPDLRALTAAFRRAGFPSSDDDGALTVSDPRLQFVFFFEGNNRSPTDRPEHFRHANSAYATAGVWIADGEDSPLVAALKSVGCDAVTENVFAPGNRTATVVRVQNGDVVFLPKSSQTILGRPLVGAVFLTRDLAALRRCLDAAHIPSTVNIEAADHRSIVVGPQQTLGMWLEFRQLQGATHR
jgi:catechol 2,3-dioxygenase-like lactoylglutathione lyase family enzyme